MGKLPLATRLIWDTASGKEKLHLPTQGLAVAFGPDGRTLTAVTRYGLVQHWDLATKKCLEPPADTKPVDFVFVENAISSGVDKTLVLTDGRSVVMKNADNGKTVRRFESFQTEKLPTTWDAKSLAVAMQGSAASVMALEIAKLAALHNRESERSVPFEVKLSSRKDAYHLDLNGKTPEEFARQIHRWPRPDAPKVDMVLTIQNKGAKTLTFDRDISINLYLTGEGAINHPMDAYQTGLSGDEPEKEKVALAPGKTFEVPIRSLHGGHGEQSYWLLPGEYKVHADCSIYLTTSPDYGNKDTSSRFVHLNAPPLRVKVVAAKK